MDFQYSEIISVQKWADAKAQGDLKTVVQQFWDEHVTSMGYHRQGKADLTLAPMWRDETGTLTEVPGEGEAEVYKVTVSATIVPD